MPRNAATVSNAQLLRPDVVRNQMMETVDQMERINMGDQQGYASASAIFPTVNLDNPVESYYQYDGVTSAMSPVGFDAEPPLMSLDLPSKAEVTIESYKEAFNPKRGVETTLSSSSGAVPFSVYQRGVSKLNTKIWLTRELISWRGDSAVDGLVGKWGNTPHSEVAAEGNVRTVATAWSDAANATPVADIEDLAFDITNNGTMTGNQVMPSIFMGPKTLRDAKNTDEMADALPSNQYQRVTQDAVSDIIGEYVNDIRLVMVYYPRTNANGEYLDDAGNIVDDADDAVLDNILEPYDPVNDVVRRNVILGRPGAGSAYFPWYLDRLTEDVGPGEVPGEMSVDQQNGFLTYVWKKPSSRETYVSAEQELGFEVQQGSNFGVISGV